MYPMPLPEFSQPVGLLPLSLFSPAFAGTSPGPPPSCLPAQTSAGQGGAAATCRWSRSQIWECVRVAGGKEVFGGVEEGGTAKTSTSYTTTVE